MVVQAERGAKSIESRGRTSTRPTEGGSNVSGRSKYRHSGKVIEVLRPGGFVGLFSVKVVSSIIADCVRYLFKVLSSRASVRSNLIKRLVAIFVLRDLRLFLEVHAALVTDVVGIADAGGSCSRIAEGIETDVGCIRIIATSVSIWTTTIASTVTNTVINTAVSILIIDSAVSVTVV